MLGATVDSMTRDGRAPTPDDFQEQLDALEELESIDNRLRWVAAGGIERFLLQLRRGDLIERIDAWNREFAAADDQVIEEDLDGHAG